MKKNVAVGLALSAFLACNTGCTTTPTPTTAKKFTTAGAAKISGKVLETMDGGGYTYVLVQNDDKKTWAAIPTAKVAVGEQIDLQAGSVLKNFQSKALNRTFESIVFSGGLQKDLVEKKPTGEDPKYAGKMSETPILAGKVVETMSAQTYTYLLLEKDGKYAWAAVPATPVKIGDTVELIPGIDMGKFTSSKLNRVFDAIHFSAGIKNPKKQEAAKQEAAKQEAAKQAESQKTAPNAAASQLPPSHPALPKEAAPTAPVAKGLEGEIVETMDSGGYSYICVEKDGKKTWAAIPMTEVKVGQKVSLTPGMEMTNFNSKSLNRTFESIVFSNGFAK